MNTFVYVELPTVSGSGKVYLRLHGKVHIDQLVVGSFCLVRAVSLGRFEALDTL